MPDAPQSSRGGDLGAQGALNDRQGPINESFVPVYTAEINLETGTITDDNSNFVSIESTLLDKAIANISNQVDEKAAALDKNASLSVSGHMLDLKLMFRIDVDASGSAKIA
jgi:hypothetical protein